MVAKPDDIKAKKDDAPNDKEMADNIQSMIAQMRQNVGNYGASVADKKKYLPKGDFNAVDNEFKKASDQFAKDIDTKLTKLTTVSSDKGTVDAACAQVERAYRLAFKALMNSDEAFNEKAEPRLKARLEGVKKTLLTVADKLADSTDKKNAQEFIKDEIARLETQVVSNQIKRLQRDIEIQRANAFDELIKISTGKQLTQFYRFDEYGKEAEAIAKRKEQEKLTGIASGGDTVLPDKEGYFNRGPKADFNIHIGPKGVTFAGKVPWYEIGGAQIKNFEAGWNEALECMQRQLKSTRFTYDLSSPEHVTTDKLDVMLKLAEKRKMAISWGPNVMQRLAWLGQEKQQKYIEAARALRDKQPQAGHSAPSSDVLENNNIIKKVDDSLAKMDFKNRVAGDDKEKEKNAKDLIKASVSIDDVLKNEAKPDDKKAKAKTEADTRLKGIDDEMKKLKDRSDVVKETIAQLNHEVKVLVQDHKNDIPAKLLTERQVKLEALSSTVAEEMADITLRIKVCEDERAAISAAVISTNVIPKDVVLTELDVVLTELEKKITDDAADFVKEIGDIKDSMKDSVPKVSDIKTQVEAVKAEVEKEEKASFKP